MTRLVLLAIAAVLALAGCGSSVPVPTFDAPATTQAAPTAPVPQRVEIPSLGVSSSLMDLHVDPVTDELEAPPIEGDPMQAGWYADGVRPGETGPAVIAAHVNAHGQAGLFKDLHTMKPGDTVLVDNLTFVVEKVEQYNKDQFPTDKVYGNTDRPALRLITCGGELEGRHYADNIVVYATLQ